MTTSSTPNPRKRTRKSAGKTVPLKAASLAAITVEHLTSPPKFVKPKGIHPRRLLPLVREGAEREFHSQTPETFMRPMAKAAPLTPAEEVVVVTHTELT